VIAVALINRIPYHTVGPLFLPAKPVGLTQVGAILSALAARDGRFAGDGAPSPPGADAPHRGTNRTST
jgi:hypothetical protein